VVPFLGRSLSGITDGGRLCGIRRCSSGSNATSARSQANTEAQRENPTTGTTPFRKAYLRSLIEVDDEQARIKGSMDDAGKGGYAGGSETGQRSQMIAKWRTRHDAKV